MKLELERGALNVNLRAYVGPELRYQKTGIFSIELSALRGIACMVVVIFHCLVMFKVDGWGYHEVMQLGLFAGTTWQHWLLKALFILFNGSAAVIFFFVLSGTVLGMSFEHDSIFTAARNFYARRLVRIVPSMWLSVLIGFIYVSVVHPTTIFPHAGTGLNEWYKQPATLQNLVLGLLSYKSYFNPVNWSLYIEFIGSFLFPLFVWMLRYRNTAILTWLVLIACFIHLPMTYARSNVYIIDFAVGLSILQWGRGFAAWLRSRSTIVRRMILCGALLSIGAARLTLHAYPHFVTNIFEAGGAASVIAYVLFSGERFDFLQRGFWTFIGRISYSLYLSHFIIFFAPAYFLASYIDPAVALRFGLLLNFGIMAVCVPISIAVSFFLYEHVESKALRASKRLRGGYLDARSG
jgi:peptidoglycan/LPS O-acetylase OafA/YrhL